MKLVIKTILISIHINNNYASIVFISFNSFNFFIFFIFHIYNKQNVLLQS